MMNDFALNELELAPPEVVIQSARDFAVALAETPQFKMFEAATDRLNNDLIAQRAMEAYQTKQESLQTMLMLNAVSAEERADLEQLRLAFMNQPSVVMYFQAQADLMAICQASADWLSEAIGLNFAVACGSGCC
jgi:cell fate (sporulation/competence/biofilm development) regulator YlbF (YheA/YmcA/DUF963 family)